SAAWNRTEPVRLRTMPMIAFSVVVLPAPLRPSSVTTSPGKTSKSTPCRMCDSPYQALSPRTLSSGSGMGRAHVGLHDVGIARDRPVRALREHLASGEARDGVGEGVAHAGAGVHH